MRENPRSADSKMKRREHPAQTIDTHSHNVRNLKISHRTRTWIPQEQSDANRKEESGELGSSSRPCWRHPHCDAGDETEDQSESDVGTFGTVQRPEKKQTTLTSRTRSRTTTFRAAGPKTPTPDVCASLKTKTTEHSLDRADVQHWSGPCSCGHVSSPSQSSHAETDTVTR